MSTRLRIGILGIGQSWPRWRRALHGLRSVLELRAVCDQLPARADRAARQLRCRPAAGPAELMHRDDVDAVLLLSRQWYGLWPLTLAASLGKPIYCAVSLAHDEQHAEQLQKLAETGRLRVQMALSPWAAPALIGLREKLGSDAGQPLLVRADCWREEGDSTWCTDRPSPSSGSSTPCPG